MAASVLTVEEANQAVDGLVNIIERGGFRLTVNEVIKAGSLGHGTAVPGDFDLDLVLYSSDVHQKLIKAGGELRQATLFDTGYKYYLEKIESFLRFARVPGVGKIVLKPYAVNFQYYGIDVDLLVSPNWSTPSDLWNFLQDVGQDQIFNFSVNTLKWQVLFFSGQPSEVKELIKRAKAWRNKVWARSNVGRPKSYLLSLLVLKAYQYACDRGVTSSTIARETAEELKKIVRSHQSQDIYWERYYQLEDLSNTYGRLNVPRPPRILDPANPTNNLYQTGFGKGHDYEKRDGNWTQLVANIGTMDLTKTVEQIQKEQDIQRRQEQQRQDIQQRQEQQRQDIQRRQVEQRRQEEEQRRQVEQQRQGRCGIN